MIGDPPNQITITFLHFGKYGDKVRLGLDADRSIPIFRSELLPGGAKERRQEPPCLRIEARRRAKEAGA